jgi:hypothetical protein
VGLRVLPFSSHPVHGRLQAAFCCFAASPSPISRQVSQCLKSNNFSQGLVHYPDFFRPSTVKWWQNQIASFHDELGFDGMW